MTNRVMSTWLLAATLGLPVAILSTTMITAAAATPRVGNVAADVKAAAADLKPEPAIAPRFDPETPTKLDEFTSSPNLRSVHFDFDRATVRGGDARILAHDARWLKANAPYEVLIEGYADERGTKPY